MKTRRELREEVKALKLMNLSGELPKDASQAYFQRKYEFDSGITTNSLNNFSGYLTSLNK